jgi:hypothetical protein
MQWIGLPDAGSPDPSATGTSPTRRRRSGRKAGAAVPALAARGDAVAVSPDDGPAAETVPTQAVRRSKAIQNERRRQLWRDSATILIAVVMLLLAGQIFLPEQTATPGGSPTPLPSAVAIGSIPPPATLPPGATFGPILNPSLGVDATPTPIPVITMGPTPSPSPSIVPTSSVRPSVKPTVKPTPTPAPPVARFSGTVNLLTLTVTNTSTGIVSGETTWLWNFGDGATAAVRNPGSHTYKQPGTYTVKLTMTTAFGTDSAQHSYTVVAPATAPPPSSVPSPSDGATTGP